MTKRDDGGPYGSAKDLPSFRTLAEQIQGAKALTLFIGRDQRDELKRIKHQLQELTETVDRFYALLGERNWVFHDDLSPDAVRALTGPEATPESAEQGLIAIYQAPETLSFMVRHLVGLEGLRVRMPLIERAVADYQASRYYATTLVLLTVMDGFVNELDNPRKGLHARGPEDLVAWDSVVGHHLGLSHAHRSFIRSNGKTQTEEVFELHRNGILHGTIIHYDNVVVATKAWNRLFAVADWARSRERAVQPPTPKPSLTNSLRQLVQLNRDQAYLKTWNPSSIDVADERSAREPVFARATAFLDAWLARNYGTMSEFLPPSLFRQSSAARPLRARQLFESSPLTAYAIERLHFVAAPVCELDLVLDPGPNRQLARMRWIREKSDGKPAMREEQGTWFLYTWGAQAMIGRRLQSS